MYLHVHIYLFWILAKVKKLSYKRRINTESSDELESFPKVKTERAKSDETSMKHTNTKTNTIASTTATAIINRTERIRTNSQQKLFDSLPKPPPLPPSDDRFKMIISRKRSNCIVNRISISTSTRTSTEENTIKVITKPILPRRHSTNSRSSMCSIASHVDDDDEDDINDDDDNKNKTRYKKVCEAIFKVCIQSYIQPYNHTYNHAITYTYIIYKYEGNITNRNRICKRFEYIGGHIHVTHD